MFQLVDNQIQANNIMYILYSEIMVFVELRAGKKF